MRVQRTIAAVILLIGTMLISLTARATPQSADMFKQYAYAGQFAEGANALAIVVAQDPEDMEARFGLGALQFLKAVDGLQDALYRYGAGNALAAQTGRNSILGVIPILRLPVPPNANAEVASYEAVREIFSNFVTDLDKARKTLSTIEGRPVRLPMNPLKISVDIDRDGKISKYESILGAAFSLSGRRQQMPDGGIEMTIVFDTADVSWLQGYSNALMAVGKFFLAFDFEETYETSFQVAFGLQSTRFGRELALLQPPKEEMAALLEEVAVLQERLDALKISAEDRKKQRELRNQLRKLAKTAETTNERAMLNQQIQNLELSAEQRSERRKLRGEIRSKRASATGRQPGSYDSIFDAIAFVHSLNWTVISPKYLADVRLHLMEVMRLNRVTWKAVMAESDNDGEWLPNPEQDGPFPDIRVTQETIDNWLNVVGFAEGVLEGKNLIPHPRFSRGINLKKFFETAESFDLIMFISGPNSVPYLQKEGEIVSEQTWRAIARPFSRNFGLFLIWFN